MISFEWNYMTYTYKQKEGFTPHRTLSAHVSVDKPERVKIIGREKGDRIGKSSIYQTIGKIGNIVSNKKK